MPYARTDSLVVSLWPSLAQEHTEARPVPRLARLTAMTMECDDDELLALLAMEPAGYRRSGSNATTAMDSDSSQRTTPRDELDEPVPTASASGATVANEEGFDYVRQNRRWWRCHHGVIDTTPWGLGRMHQRARCLSTVVTQLGV